MPFSEKPRSVDEPQKAKSKISASAIIDSKARMDLSRETLMRLRAREEQEGVPEATQLNMADYIVKPGDALISIVTKNIKGVRWTPELTHLLAASIDSTVQAGEGSGEVHRTLHYIEPGDKVTLKDGLLSVIPAGNFPDGTVRGEVSTRLFEI
ncbi:MAG: hypothetical protein WC897_04645 [Candidatus Gracilibacteria bacterium]